MTTAAETLAAALEREHHEIDTGIEEFLAARAQGEQKVEPLERAMDALKRHIYLEEAFMFPPLRKAGLMAPLMVMVREHGELWDTMDEIDAQLDAETSLGEEICRKLLEQLAKHNSKEEQIVYPQADARLDAATDASLRAFIANGQMPEGWVCAKAQSAAG